MTPNPGRVADARTYYAVENGVVKEELPTVKRRHRLWEPEQFG